MKKVFVLLVLFFVLILPLFAKYHPGIKWREIADDKFIVIFPKGYESEAFYTIKIAHDIYNKLQNMWDMRRGESNRGIPTREASIVKTKIRIVLNDSYDDANGSATFFPFNWIEIYLFTPAPDSTIAGCQDWIYMVLAHEMNHIFNMNGGSGFTYFMRKIIGANPVFFPMIYAPNWLAEGLSVYAESQLGAGGRLDTPDFEIMLKNIAAAGKVPGFNRIFGNPTPWPGPVSWYLYGSGFVQFLVNRYGEHKVRELVHNFGCHFVPLVLSSRFKRVFNKGLKQLWSEFIESIDTSGSVDESKINILTKDGLTKDYPVFGPVGKIFFVDRNYKEFPGIYELDLSTRRSRRLLKKTGINSLFYDREEEKLYFSALRYFKTYYRYSDIYEFDLKKKKTKRLSKGRRLSYPVKNGNKIYCVKRAGAKSFLTVLNEVGGKEKIISAGYDSLAQIALSPDKKYVAVSLKRKNRSWSIALFNLQGELLNVLTPGDVKSYAPQWKNSDEVCFITENNGHYRLACFNLKTNTCYIIRDNTVPDIKHFSFHPDSGKWILSYFDTNGFNLGLLKAPLTEDLPPAARGAFLKNRPPGPPEKLLINRQSTPSGKIVKSFWPHLFSKRWAAGGNRNKIKKYNFLRELLPKYYTINYRDAGGEIQPGLYLSGNDALEKHAFILEGFYGFKSNTFNVSFNYTYDGLYPTLIFNYIHFTDLYKNQDNREYNHHMRGFEAASLLPLSYSMKRQSYFYTGVYFEDTVDEYEDTGRKDSQNMDGIRFAYLFSSLKKYYDSISYSDGLRFSLSFAREFKFMGSDYNINTLAFEYQQFLSIFRPNVFALRFAVSDSWGDEAYRVFYMGGAESKDLFTLAGGNMFDLMRGFPKGFFYGSGGYILNAEFRISLFKVERVFNVIRTLDRVYLTLFSDMGNLWLKEKKVNPSYSFGLELSVVAYIGDEKFDFCGGMAIGQNPYHAPVFYLRLGRSF